MKPLDPRFLSLLRPARRELAGVVAAQVALGVLVVAQAFALGHLVVATVETVGGAGSGAADGAAGSGGEVLRPAAWFALVTVARAVAGVVGARCAAAATRRVGADLRRRLLGAVAAGGPALDGRRRGEVVLLATRGLTALEPYLTRYLPSLVVATVLPPLTLVAVATQDLLSALVVVLTLPLLPVFAVLVGQATRDRAARQWRALSVLAGHFVDVVAGLRTLVTFGRAEAQADAVRAVTRRYRDASRETLRLGFASSAVLELLATLSVALVAVTVGLRLATGSVPFTTAMVVLLLAPEAYWPVRRVGAEFHAAAEGTATLEAVHQTLATTPKAGEDARRAPDATADVVLDRVSLAHPGRPPVVRELSSVVPGRGITAVVGPSGCGKSTLLAALVGDLAPESGRVLVGGVPLHDVRDAWRRRVAWMPQRPWLAGGTLADELRLGRPDASGADLRAALDRVGLALPLDAGVGEDGQALSAGQRARVALARALVSGRPWLVLDEPTAHLDATTEEVVLRVLREEAAAGRAVVVVAHRPALVAAADHVVTLPGPDAAAAPRAATQVRVPDAPGRPLRTDARSEPPEQPCGSGPRRPRRGVAGLATALGVLSSASGVALTATAGWLVARSAEQPPVLTLLVAIVGVRLFGLARPVLRYGERLLSHDHALSRLAERRAAVYAALVPLVPGALPRERGDLLASLVDDVDADLDGALRVRQPLVTAAVVAVGATLALLALLPRDLAAAGALAGLATTAATGALLVRARTRRTAAEGVAHRAEQSRRTARLLEGLVDLRLWQAEGGAVEAAARAGDRAAAADARAVRAVAAGQAAVVLAAGAAVVATALWLAAAPGSTTVSGPVAALLVLLPVALAEVLLPAVDAAATSVRVGRARDRVEAVLDRAPRVRDEGRAPAPVAGRTPGLVLDAVVPGWDGPVATPVDVDLPAGTRVAVVGASGSGKSTLAETLVRGLDPVDGTVRLDGTDLRALPLAAVRATVGLLDDDPHVFGSTLRENLRLASPGRADADLEAALEAVALGAWYAALPDGLDTRLGDGGAAVSGGERARLGLARLVLSGHPVWVLDEPTAHLDAAAAEALAAEVLDPGGVGVGRTVVWIGHGRLAADRVDVVVRVEERMADPAGPAGPAGPTGSERDEPVMIGA